MRSFNPSRRTEKFLEKLARGQPGHFRQVDEKLRGLCADPFPPDSKPLIRAGDHRADIGEYRIIYNADADALNVLLVGKRNDDEIYRKYKRLAQRKRR